MPRPPLSWPVEQDQGNVCTNWTIARGGGAAGAEVETVAQALQLATRV